LLQSILNQEFVAAADHLFGCQVDVKCTVQGIIRVCSSDFTRMPKGSITLQIAAHSQFSAETESVNPEAPLITSCSGLVIRFSKIVDKEGEELTYRLSERDFV
jgi:hypothetical protein